MFAQIQFAIYCLAVPVGPGCLPCFQVDTGIHKHGSQSSVHLESQENHSNAKTKVLHEQKQSPSLIIFINLILLLECPLTAGSNRQRIRTLSKLQVLLTKRHNNRTYKLTCLPGKSGKTEKPFSKK